MQEDAINDAKASRNADLLINATEFQTYFFIPLPIVQINCIIYTIEGTAAKMTIGLQILK
jgi:hypothetical protein